SKIGFRGELVTTGDEDEPRDGNRT
ncbi:unnamed protein product, partial [Allacma fusca]